MLELISGNGQVVRKNVDIRKHNRTEIEKHPMYKRKSMIEGDCVSEEIVSKVREIAKNKKRVMVFLDSNHTHEHVL